MMSQHFNPPWDVVIEVVMSVVMKNFITLVATVLII